MFKEEEIQKALEELKSKASQYDDGCITWQELSFSIIRACHMMEVFFIEHKQ